MNKFYKITFILLIVLASSNKTSAQLKQWGLQVGYSNAKLNPQKNIISEQLFVREGRSVSGFTIGGNFTLSKPKDQVKKGMDLRYKVLLEGNICRCGGNMSVTSTNLDGTRNFSDLRYLFYIIDFSGKFVVQSKKISLMAGPVVNRIFYAGYEVNKDGKLFSATSDFNTNSIGYELGLGYEINRINLILRYLQIVTDFGNALSGNRVDFTYRQIRLGIAMVIFEKDRAKNWDSIIWNK